MSYWTRCSCCNQYLTPTHHLRMMVLDALREGKPLPTGTEAAKQFNISSRGGALRIIREAKQWYANTVAG